MADYKQDLNEKPLKKQYFEANLNSLLEDMLKEPVSENISQSEKEFLELINILEKRYEGAEDLVECFRKKYNEMKDKKVAV